MTRKAVVHVGTHKTGTKSIQLYFSRHWEALRNAGLYQPNAGRHKFDETNATPGHHDLAFDLLRDRRESLDELVRELRAQASRDVFISSEEFHPLAGGGRLALLRDALAHEGYEPTAVVYLRAQPEYAQSMYAEISKAYNARGFRPYLQEICGAGVLSTTPAYQIFFEYSKLVVALAQIFGERNIIVRPYAGAREPAALVRDMIRVVCAVDPTLKFPPLGDPSLRLNRRGSFLDVLSDIHEGARRAVSEAPDVNALLRRFGFDVRDPRLSRSFSALTRDETLSIVRRFAEDNARVEAMSSIAIPGTREADVPREHDPLWENAAWQRALLDVMTDVWFR